MTARRVVGIGASAGGLESLGQLFANLPPDAGNAYVVVQHLSPGFPSLMDELLARHTRMPVMRADDGTVLAANHVYVMPPAKHMIVRAERLVLSERAPQTFGLPIDTFFRSLAHDLGERAVAVVLSGAGSDGSRGIVEVKQCGGLVVAESVRSARFDGMPSAAAATGAVDHTGSPAELARVIASLPAVAEPGGAAAKPAFDPLAAILALVEARHGIDVTSYRTATMKRRILRRCQDIAPPAVYLEQLRGDAEELDALARELLVGDTQFFRDPEAFDVLESAVLPRLSDRLDEDDELRIWVAGCATGEEAYSIAMLCLEAGRVPRITATDIHEASLATAAAGVYPPESIANVSEARLKRFFSRTANGWAVTQELRDAVDFVHHDVTRDTPFTEMHLITCRNVMIYLQPAMQRAVLALFHFSLVTRGYLFLGASELPAMPGHDFATVDDRWRIYQKHRDAPAAGPVIAGGDAGERRMLAVCDQLLDLYMPPGFLLDSENNLLDSFAGAEQLLQPRARRPSRQLLEMLDEELRIVVDSALQRIAGGATQVAYANVPIELGRPARCTVTARSITSPRTPYGYVLITFDDAG